MSNPCGCENQLNLKFLFMTIVLLNIKIYVCNELIRTHTHKHIKHIQEFDLCTLEYFENGIDRCDDGSIDEIIWPRFCTECASQYYYRTLCPSLPVPLSLVLNRTPKAQKYLSEHIKSAYQIRLM